MVRDDSRNPGRPVRSQQDIWRKWDPIERRLTRPLTMRMLDLAGLTPGMQVLDIGTGRGEPAIPAAQRVAPTGGVVGVDVSEDMLQLARERAYDERVTNLKLDVQSAESLSGIPFEYFDAALARWSLMYLQSPAAALTAIARSLTPQGTLTAAMWAEPERVPYFSLPRNVLAKYAPVPDTNFEGPGIFRYAQLDHIKRDFTEAGLTVEHVEEHKTDVMATKNDRDLIEWTRDFGMERLLKDLPAEVQAAWESDLAKEARAFSKSGIFRLGGVTRIIVARRAC